MTTKKTKIKRASEKARRYDDAIRHLREVSRQIISCADTGLSGVEQSAYMLAVAGLEYAAEILASARD